MPKDDPLSRITDRSGIPVPRRVQLLESDVDKMESLVANLTTEMTKGRTSNNRLLTAILLSLIAVFATVAVTGLGGIAK